MKFERKFKRKLLLTGILIILMYIFSYTFNIVLINRNIIILLFLIVLVFSFLYFFLVNKNKERIKKIIYTIFDYFSVVIYAIIFVKILFNFVVFPATVQQSSMNPTLYENDKLIVSSGNNKIERFDVVVIKIDKDQLYDHLQVQQEDGNLWVKRVIGLPGEKIEFIDGKLFVNNQEVYEEYLYDENGNFYDGLQGESLSHGFCTITKDFVIDDVLKITVNLDEDLVNKGVIPEDYYLLLGDNRCSRGGFKSSLDSRQIGLIHKSMVVGEGKYIMRSLFNWEKIGD